MEIQKEISTEVFQTPKKDINENEHQDSPTKSQSHVTKSTFNPNPVLPVLMYDRDNDFAEHSFRVKSEVQAGQVSGHYLRIQGGRVSADARKHDAQAGIIIHCYHDHQLEQDLWIFESAFDRGKFIAIINNKVTVKRIQGALTSITQVQANHPEILFVKKPLSSGSTVFTLRLFSPSSASKKYYLGFDKVNGSAMDPSKVRPSQKEAKFKIFTSF